MDEKYETPPITGYYVALFMFGVDLKHHFKSMDLALVVYSAFTEEHKGSDTLIRLFSVDGHYHEALMKCNKHL